MVKERNDRKIHEKYPRLRLIKVHKMFTLNFVINAATLNNFHAARNHKVWN